MNSTMQGIDRGGRPTFDLWSEFCDAFPTAFESVMDNEDMRRQLCNLKQTGHATRYVQWFRVV